MMRQTRFAPNPVTCKDSSPVKSHGGSGVTTSDPPSNPESEKTMNKTSTPAPVVKHGITIEFSAITLNGSLHHDDERRALMLMTEEGPERVSVNLEAYGLVPAPGHVYVKDWSEHSGLAESLQRARLARIVRSVEVGPFSSTAYEVEVTL